MTTPELRSLLKRRLIFVTGKGGVGKSTLSLALGEAYSRKGLQTLSVTFDDPLYPSDKPTSWGDQWTFLNCSAARCFEQYAAMKIGIPSLARIFLRNSVMRYLAQAAPGFHELVLMGKVWFEREHYDRIVVDMPSSGYAVAMFQSPKNFAELFGGGAVKKDAEAIMKTFSDPKTTGALVVSLAEDMPLIESLELGDLLSETLAGNLPAYLVNRSFPQVSLSSEDPSFWKDPLAQSAEEYVQKRSQVENFNLKIWDEQNLVYERFPWVHPEKDLRQTLAQKFAGFV